MTESPENAPVAPVSPITPTAPVPTPSDLIGYGAAALAVALWSFAFPTSKLVMEDFQFQHVVLIRYLTASVFFTILALLGFSKIRAIITSKRDMLWLALLGFIGISCYHNLFTAGIATESSASAAIVIAAVPVMSALVARLFFAERLTPTGWIGVAIAFAGIAVVFFAKGGELHASTGLILLLIAASCSAFYFVFQRKLSSGVDAMTLTTVSCFFGTAPLLYFLPSAVEAVQIVPVTSTLLVVAMGLLSSGMGYALWFFALKRLPVAQVTSFLFLQPAFSACLGWLMLGEIVTLPVILSALITVGGVSLVVFRGKRAA